MTISPLSIRLLQLYVTEIHTQYMKYFKPSYWLDYISPKIETRERKKNLNEINSSKRELFNAKKCMFY